MADNIEHLMLEQFRKQREHIDHVLAEVRNLKVEMQAVRLHMRGVEIDGDTHRDTLARLETRVERIEKRLELVDGSSRTRLHILTTSIGANPVSMFEN